MIPLEKIDPEQDAIDHRRRERARQLSDGLLNVVNDLAVSVGTSTDRRELQRRGWGLVKQLRDAAAGDTDLGEKG